MEILPIIISGLAAASSAAGVGYQMAQGGGTRAQAVPGAPTPPPIKETISALGPRHRAGLQASGITSSPFFESESLAMEAYNQLGRQGSLEDYIKQASQFLGTQSLS